MGVTIHSGSRAKPATACSDTFLVCMDCRGHGVRLPPKPRRTYPNSLAEVEQIPVRTLGYVVILSGWVEDIASSITEDAVVHVCVFYNRVCIVLIVLAIQNQGDSNNH